MKLINTTTPSDVENLLLTEATFGDRQFVRLDAVPIHTQYKLRNIDLLETNPQPIFLGWRDILLDYITDEFAERLVSPISTNKVPQTTEKYQTTYTRISNYATLTLDALMYIENLSIDGEFELRYLVLPEIYTHTLQIFNKNVSYIYVLGGEGLKPELYTQKDFIALAKSKVNKD